MISSIDTHCKFTTESEGERILKIGQYVVKLSAIVESVLFFDSRGIYDIAMVHKNFRPRAANSQNSGPQKYED